MSRTGLAVAAVVACAVVAGAIGGAAAAVDEPADGEFVVEIEANGDAEVTFVRVDDLEDPEQAARFEELEDNPDTRAADAERIRDALQFEADRSNEVIDREMRVTDASLELQRRDDDGYRSYAVRWENLALVDGDRLVLSEPFSLYDELDRKLVVVAPDGYEIASATPEPDEGDGRIVSWPGLTPLEDFEVVVEAADSEGGTVDEASDDEPQPDPDDQSGFGVIAALGALAAAALFARRAPVR